MPLSLNTNNIPSESGVYVFKDDKGQILYIGKAKNLQKRVQQYFSPGSLRKQEMIAQADKLDFHVVKNESEALYLEDNLIKQHQPFYNKLLKADNSYVYIKITDEEFPQIVLTRKKVNDKGIYIGPKHNTQHLKKFLQYLRQVLKFRGCKTSQFRQHKLCSDYYFGICKGWCALATGHMPHATGNPKHGNGSLKHKTGNLKLEAGSMQPNQEYDNLIRVITSFFKGNTKPISDLIKQQIQEAIQTKNFERAAKLRDIFVEIGNLTEQQTVVLPEKMTGYIIQVKPVGKWRIYIILYFYEGKLIDIIRHKEHQSEKESDEIIFDLQREFGTLYEQKTPDGLLFSTLKKGIPLDKVGKPKAGGFAELLNHLFQSYIINSSFDENNLMNDLLSTMQKRYGLKNFPYKIECIDISHLSGGRVSGGLACLLGGIKYPHGYRRYKIRGKTKDERQKTANDYESLKELIGRRIKSGELPDLLLIDGGKGQLNIVQKLCKESKKMKELFQNIDVMSLGKGEARNRSKIGTTSTKGVISEKIYVLQGLQTIHVFSPVYDETDKLLISARDEAHRFANVYRKAQMSQEFKKK